MRERAEAVGLSLAELEQLCLGPGGVVDALRRLAVAEGEAALAPVADAATEAPEAPEASSTPKAEPDRRLGVGRTGWRQHAGPSIVLSIRFDPDEYDRLCRRAEAKGMGVSVLARSYVRKGLGAMSVRLPD